MALLARSSLPSMGLLGKWEELAQLDANRRSIEMTLKEMLEEAERTEKDLRKQVKRMEAYEEDLAAQVEELQLQCKSLQETADNSPFVMLLIDGDITQFLDGFVKAGLDGGRDAAQLLRRQLEQRFREFIPDFQSHWKIMVHVYANLHGLAETYHRVGVVSDPGVARKFFSGFNRELNFFEFIDAGNDKEGADRKIKEYFKMYHGTANCKHIMLASSGDRSYVGDLRQFCGETSRISLVEAVPFEPAYQTIAKHFRTETFQNIFKSTKLEMPPPLRLSPTSSNSYATITSTPTKFTAAVGPSMTIRPRSTSSDDQPAGSGRVIKFNKNGERIDDLLPYADREIVQRLQNIRLETERPCARFNLTRCLYGSGCKFDHRRKYNADEKKAIRRLARHNPCMEGVHCRDGDCLSSHNCPYGSRCFVNECRFGFEMHNMDTDVVEEIQV